jgi:hypothetical protein
MDGGVSLGLRVGHLSRVSSYLDWATLGMWAVQRRATVMMGMAEASLRHPGPGGGERPRRRPPPAPQGPRRRGASVPRADDFPAAMARMRVAQDLVSLRIIALAGE